MASMGLRHDHTDDTQHRTRIYKYPLIYTGSVAKHLVEIDEQALAAARAELGTSTIRDTVNAALRRATAGRDARVAAALDALANAGWEDRDAAWR
jgi:Arc/MetJ family transcription regulator